MSKGLRIILALSFVLGAVAFLTSPWLTLPAIVMTALTLWPFRREKRIWFVGDVESEHSIIARRREEALRALKDLEEEFLAGKLTREDYDKRRPDFLQTAKELTLKLDKVREQRKQTRDKIERELSA
ncbi:MAG: hypothetical protein ACYTDT_03075 [Planctomycetota bacterium]|jgi:hypothetical protein